MTFVDLGDSALVLIIVLFIIYMAVAFRSPDTKNYGPLVGLGIFIFGSIFVMVIVMHGRLKVTEKLYLQHLELKTECEFVIPRSDECIPVIQYVPEHRG